MPNTAANPRFKSKAVLQSLMAEFPAMRDKGFRKAVRDAVGDDPAIREACQGFLPDGFCVLPETKEIHAIEIVDTSPISFDKGHLIASLGEEMHERGWTLSVAAFDYAHGLICHLPFYCFARYYTNQFAGQELRDVLPAARAVHRILSNPEGASYRELLDASARIP